MKKILAPLLALAVNACDAEPTPSAPNHMSTCNDEIQRLAAQTANTAQITGLGVSGFPEVTSVYEAPLSEVTTGQLELVVKPSPNLIEAGIGGDKGMHCVAYNGVNEGWTIRMDDMPIAPIQSAEGAVWQITIGQLPIDSRIVYMKCGMVPPVSNPPSVEAFDRIGERVFFNQISDSRDNDPIYTTTPWFDRAAYHNSNGTGTEPGTATLLENAWEIRECE